MHILDIQMKDNVKASILQADGTYTKPDKRGKTLVNSQEYFCREATERAEKTERTGKQQGVCAGRTGGIGLDGHGRGRGSAHCVDMKEEYGML